MPGTALGVFGVLSPTLQRRTPQHSEMKWLAQDHPAGERHGQGSNPAVGLRSPCSRPLPFTAEMRGTIPKARAKDVAVSPPDSHRGPQWCWLLSSGKEQCALIMCRSSQSPLLPGTADP